MKNKKIKLFVLTILLSFICISNTYAEQPIKLWINGNYVTTDVAPLIENGRTLVPIRVISESLGKDVEWNAEAKQVLIPNGEIIIAFQIDSNTYGYGDIAKQLDVAPKIINGRTMVPIRAVAESLGINVDWDASNRTVVIGEGYTAPVSPQKPQTTNTFEEVTVTRVVDGDTIVVNRNGQEQKLRMILVDTSETVHPNKPVQYYGKEASNFTKSQLTGKTVYLQKDVSDTDRYGRLLRYVWLSRPTTDNPTKYEIVNNMYNAILIKDGYGQLVTVPPDVKYVDIFKELNEQARNQNKGLWANPNGIVENNNSNSSDNNNIVPNQTGNAADYANGRIIGNKNSKIYHIPGGKSYNKVSAQNAVYFNTEAEAQAAGYKKAKLR